MLLDIEDRFPSRADMLRRGVDAAAHRGLEIGALNHPTVRPEEGNVEFVDFAPTETLRRLHAALPERAAGIVDVDHVWSGAGSLKAIIGDGERYDYAIASHVIEHVPNVLGWFRGIHDVLRPGGVFNLAVPDKRYTFDARRQPSTLGQMIEADLLDFDKPSIRQMFDHCHLAVALEPGANWTSPVVVEDLPPFMGDVGLTLAYDQALSILREGRYFDSHCWIFTPLTLARLLRDATRLGRFPFLVEDVTPTPPGRFEFYMALRRVDGDAADQSRRLGSIDGIVADLERRQTLIALARE